MQDYLNVNLFFSTFGSLWMSALCNYFVKRWIIESY